MQSLNFVGRLTTEPNLEYKNDKAKCQFHLAVETIRGNFKRTDFIPCVAWKENAENIANYVKKGQRIGIKGEFRSHLFEENGKRKAFYEIEVLEPYFY
jgi:single-strand DNA-binding protein